MATMNDANKKKFAEMYPEIYKLYHRQSEEYRKDVEMKLRHIARWNIPAFMKG